VDVSIEPSFGASRALGRVGENRSLDLAASVDKNGGNDHASRAGVPRSST